MLQVILSYIYCFLKIQVAGGVCVLPKTMQEALRYFELDAMLSMKERISYTNPTTVQIL